MELDWTTIITGLLTFVAGGGIASIVTLKQTKKEKEIDNTSKLIDEYTKLLENYKLTAETNKQKVEELTEEVNELKRDLSKAQTQIDNLRLMYMSASALKCSNLGCDKRVPPIDKEYVEKVMGVDIQIEEREKENENG